MILVCWSAVSHKKKPHFVPSPIDASIQNWRISLNALLQRFFQCEQCYTFHYIPYRWFHIIIYGTFAILVYIDSLPECGFLSFACMPPSRWLSGTIFTGWVQSHPPSIAWREVPHFGSPVRKKKKKKSYSGGFHRGRVFICLIRGVSEYAGFIDQHLLFDKYKFFHPSTILEISSLWLNSEPFLCTSDVTRGFSLKHFLTFDMLAVTNRPHFLLRTGRSGCERARVRTHLHASKSIQYS